MAKGDYHRAVRQLHLAGGSMREIAEALDVSHQRVHQMIDEAGGTAGWKPRQKAGMACSFCDRCVQFCVEVIAALPE